MKGRISKKSEGMIQLDATLHIGKGSTRDCYRHPVDSEKCIKIAQDSAKARKVQRREEHYFRCLRTRKVDLSHLAAYLGRVETNLGEGYLYELVRDEAGDVSRDFAHYLVNEPERMGELMRVLEELGRYLWSEGIVITDFRAHNMLCPVDAAGEFQKLVIVDGVLDPAGLSVANWIKPLVRRRVRRRWARGLARLRQKYPQISGWPELWNGANPD
jgi:hypothetical protein